MSHENPVEVKAMICFCYTGSYSRFLEAEEVGMEAWMRNLDFHIAVYSLAHKYGVQTLLQHVTGCFEKFSKMCSIYWEYEDVLEKVVSAWVSKSKSSASRAAVIALFQSLNAYLLDKEFSNNATSLVNTIKQRHPVLLELLYDVTMDPKNRTPSPNWICKTCKTAFEYTGTAKPEKSPDVLVCPWCRT
jgi:hypothetical protein